MIRGGSAVWISPNMLLDRFAIWPLASERVGRPDCNSIELLIRTIRNIEWRARREAINPGKPPARQKRHSKWRGESSVE